MFFSFLIFVSCLLSSSASALSYQSTVDVQFTFNPYISLAVSGDLVINGLAPGNSADSNIITITASSNSPAGYALYSSVGSSTYNYTDLRLSSTNTTNVFTNLSSNKASLSNFSDNTWGYSYSTDSGTTWQSGDADATNAPISGYSGLPIYTDPESGNTINTGVKLVNAEKNTVTEVQFKIGAKASATQVTGTYTNVVNFINVAKIVTTNYTINYNANVGTTGDTVTNMPTTATGTTTSGAVTLSTNVPARDGYTFKGWCDVDNSSDQSTCSDGTNTGTITQPGGIYALNTTETSTNVINMYAMWKSTEETPAGETWYFNDTISTEIGSGCSGYSDCYVNFINNDNEYVGIFTISEAGGIYFSFIDGPTAFDSTFYSNCSGGWCDQSYRTITITGGDDYDNAYFRTWLSANATQL